MMGMVQHVARQINRGRSQERSDKQLFISHWFSYTNATTCKSQRRPLPSPKSATASIEIERLIGFGVLLRD